MSKFTKIKTENMVKDIDFEVVSFYVVDKEEGEPYSFNTFFKEDIHDYYENILDKSTNYINQMIQLKEKGNIVLSKTPFPNQPEYFIKINDGSKMDINTATKLGLGVVRILTGDFSGEFMIYHTDTTGSDTIQEELIRLGLYTILTDSSADSAKLEKIVEKNRLYVAGLMLCELSETMEELDKVFASKKGGNNVVQFKKKL